MTSPAIPSSRRLLVAAWGGLTLGAAALLALLIQFWGARPEYADRFLILLGAAWVAWNKRATIPSAGPHAWLALPLALLAGMLFPMATFLQTQAAGGRTVLLWLDAFALFIGACSLLLAGGGWPRIRHFGFPLLFPFFALPLPSRVLGPLQQQLQEATTSIAAHLFPWVGMPVERTGFVLKLAGGDLGVAETCSGVQALTALTALAAFVAYQKGFHPMRGAILTLLAVPVVVLVNAIRVVLSGLIQDRAGREYIRGDWHDGLGFALIFLGLGLIVGMAHLLRPSSFATRPSDPVPLGATPGSPLRRVSAAVGILLLAGIFGGAVTYSLGSSREEAATQNAPLEQLPQAIGDWRGEDRPVSDEVTALLGQDRILYRSYENNLGQKISVWVIYWSSAKLVKGYHHPDVCLGNKGYRVTAKRTEILRPTDAGPIPATAREFQRGERETRFAVYWTQEGNRIWDEGDELNAQRETGFLTQPDWLGEAFSGRMTQPVGRLVILVGTEGNSPLDRDEALRFSRDLADWVYAICPWAKPER